MIIVKLFAGWAVLSALTLLLTWHLNRKHARDSLVILRLLRSDPRSWYGLQLVNVSRGALKRGSVYVTLGRLEDEGFVSSFQDDVAWDHGIPRRMYRITEAGRERLGAT